MKRGRSTGAPTKAEAARMDAIAGGECVACRIRFDRFEQQAVMFAEVHHLTIGGRHGQKRRGHDCTVGLCSWHHRGLPLEGRSMADMVHSYGPSYALSPSAFRRQIGEDDALLAAQDQLLAGKAA